MDLFLATTAMQGTTLSPPAAAVVSALLQLSLRSALAAERQYLLASGASPGALGAFRGGLLALPPPPNHAHDSRSSRSSLPPDPQLVEAQRAQSADASQTLPSSLQRKSSAPEVLPPVAAADQAAVASKQPQPLTACALETAGDGCKRVAASDGSQKAAPEAQGALQLTNVLTPPHLLPYAHELEAPPPAVVTPSVTDVSSRSAVAGRSELPSASPSLLPAAPIAVAAPVNTRVPDLPPRFSPACIRMGVSTNQGQRLTMEDFAFAMPLALPNAPGSWFTQGACFGVFDGHGGHEVAKSLVESVPGQIQDDVHRIAQAGPERVSCCFCAQQLLSPRPTALPGCIRIFDDISHYLYLC